MCVILYTTRHLVMKCIIGLSGKDRQGSCIQTNKLMDTYHIKRITLSTFDIQNDEKTFQDSFVKKFDLLFSIVVSRQR